jgi:hypothetical protein
MPRHRDWLCLKEDAKQKMAAALTYFPSSHTIVCTGCGALLEGRSIHWTVSHAYCGPACVPRDLPIPKLNADPDYTKHRQRIQRWLDQGHQFHTARNFLNGPCEVLIVLRLHGSKDRLSTSGNP